jgi:hypothetical protein
MPTTTRDYRLVPGQTREDAILTTAQMWTGSPERHSSMIVRVQMPDAIKYDEYVYECHTFRSALSIIDATYALLKPDPGALVRFDWQPYGWCDDCGEALGVDGVCDYTRRANRV